jgi:hypothetical protein
VWTTLVEFGFREEVRWQDDANAVLRDAQMTHKSHKYASFDILRVS